MPACPQCASEVEESAAACTGCGAALLPPQPILADASPSAEPAPAQGIPFSSPMFSADRDLEGIGGWLILVALGRLLDPLTILRTILTVNIPFLFGQRFELYLTSHRASAVLGGFELVTNSVFFLASLFLIYLFFARKRSFPGVIIAFFVTGVVTAAMDVMCVHALHPNLNLQSSYLRVARISITACVWVPYFLVSRRVKLTFVR